MYVFYNPNPEGKSVGDCVVRAISKLLNKPWEQVYIELCLQGFMSGDMPSSNSVWITYLKNKGYKKYLIPDSCPDCYTVSDFTDEHHVGAFLLGTGEHVVTVIDGNYYDSWNSGKEIPIYYFTKGE